MSRHRHHSHKHGQTAAQQEAARRRKVVVAAGAVALVIAAGFVGVRLWENGHYEVAEPGQSRVTTKAIISGPLTMTVDGVDYVQRPGVQTYLFLGADVLDGADLESPAYDGGGQSDLIALVVVDDANRTWRIVHVNRDTMTQVPVVNFAGRVIGYDEGQIALAYAYGDDDYTSCMNAVRAVRGLFGGQEIDGYLSIRMDGVPVLNDAVGGVEVEVLADFPGDQQLQEGVTVTLTGDQALTYVRSRYGVADETNLSRMERQRQYMAGFTAKLAGLTERSVVDLYEELDPWTYTNMGSGTIVDLVDAMDAYEQLPTLAPQGTNVQGARFMEYYLDEDELARTTAELFYEAA